MDEPAIFIEDLRAFYGVTTGIKRVSLSVPHGSTTALIGRNGAGKSTTLKALIGILDHRIGTIRINGTSTTNLKSEDIARLGVAYCPEDRGIFSSLTTHENLILPPVLFDGGLSEGAIYQMFPNLWERRDSYGNQLSGGEQQMLALARILRTGARILLLDEITEGLAPVIVQELGRVIDQLRTNGYTILLVEQNYGFASQHCDAFQILEEGITYESFLKDEESNFQPLVARRLSI